MNCRKCGQPLNGETKCSNCGTSIGYVVNNPDSFNLGSPNSNPNGYVQNNTPSTLGSNSPAMGFGWGVSEPSDGAFNNAHNNHDGINNINSSEIASIPNVGRVEDNFPVLGKHKAEDNSQNNGNSTSEIDSKKSVKKEKSLRGFKPLNKFDDSIGTTSSTKVDPLAAFNTSKVIDTNNINNTNINMGIGDGGLSRAGTVSKDTLIDQMNGGGENANLAALNSESNDGMTMDLPENNKRYMIWLIIGGAILAIILFGVYVVPHFVDIGYDRYEQENFVIKYNKEWKTSVDTNTSKVHFLYKDTGYKVIINAVSTYEELNFKVETQEARKKLYEAFYDSWRNVSGGKLIGGSETFIDLEEDGSMYAKIDYVLDDNQGVGSFYVVLCEKYDIVISFMTYCLEEDKEMFEEATMKLIEGIDYVGLTALEKEQQEYAKFKAGNIKQYKAGTLIDYTMPEAWPLDEQRTTAVQNQYNIFKFKDNMSLLEVKAYVGRYTYEGMKNSAISNFGAIKSERQMNVNGKIWYVMVTPEYTSGGETYHNELYFTISASNTYIYYVQAYIHSELEEDSFKRAYFDDSIKYILDNMTLNGVTQ